MQATLNALVDELKRAKAGGARHVVVSDESIAALRKLVDARKPKSAPAAPVSPEPPAPAQSQPRVYSQLRQPAQRAPKPPPEPTLPQPPVVMLPEGDKKTRWDALNTLVTTNPECLRHVRPGKKAVLGVGNLDSKIFFCGEAPGEEEEIQGEPFVGPAGQLLTKMIQAMGVRREEIYIGNIMNWRPEMPLASNGIQYGNRPPTEEEMRYCLPYLRAQLEIVNPEVIIALGSTAVKGLLGPANFTTLGAVRGKWREFEGKPLMVTYHPSFILRSPTNGNKRAVWEDFMKVMERVALPISDRQRRYFL